MLPTHLVRVRVRKGRIAPIFASQADTGLASIMIDEFSKASDDKERKGSLLDRMRVLEYSNDHRLVRGFYTILERRCAFKRRESPVHPAVLRREVFRESSRRGYALTDGERMRIMGEAARRLDVEPSLMEEMMWSDMEESLIIEGFRAISPEALIGEYNLALVQGMLLNCTRLECSVSQGVEWKGLLREVKRLGLMYMLDDVYGARGYGGDGGDLPSGLVCSIDGPSSIFRLTDRYGVAMARLLPALLKAREWWMRAWIVRKGTGSGGGIGARSRLYEFRLSAREVREIGVMLMPSSSESGVVEGQGGYRVYDSSIEERFAVLFNQYNTGWRLVREPEPIVVSGQAFIPDFMLEKYGRRVYVEIVGFWTKEYIERKVQKLMRVKSLGTDIILLVDRDLACSEPLQMEHLSMMKVLTFDKGIPVRQIIDHLKGIEDEITAKHMSDDTLVMDVRAYLRSMSGGSGGSSMIISVREIAERFNMTYEAALSIITSIMDELPDYEMVMNRFMIPKSMLEEMKVEVSRYERFVDACNALKGYGVPEEFCSILLSALGYTVVWKDIDVNNAVIARKGDGEDTVG
ncbi:MAG: DUF790 family protein [Candidatus Nitrosocaldus sp.]|nr:DUF790 family protein [Candidatus Nitrosocaldus sp.]MDW8000966.1 DUF790 family protein [Candidatus Nitrosocaldus sp.]